MGDGNLRSISWSCEVEGLLGVLERIDDPIPPAVEDLHGKLRELLFHVLPDTQSRYDIKPQFVSIDLVRPGYTIYRVYWRGLEVKFSAVPHHVIVWHIHIDLDVTPRLLMVA